MRTPLLATSPLDGVVSARRLTFFTLFLVPALYSIADRWRRPQPKDEAEVAHVPA